MVRSILNIERAIFLFDFHSFLALMLEYLGLVLSKKSEEGRKSLKTKCWIIYVFSLDDSVVTWSKVGQVISADNFKVLQV